MSYVDEINKRLEVSQDNDYPLYPEDMSRVVLRLETTNICNHKCAFCPNSKLERVKKNIDPDFAYRMIGEAAEMGVRRGAFFLMGEPLICPEVLDYYKYAKFEKNYNFLFFTTNGSLASEKKVEEILNSGIDSLKFSINAGTPETYCKIHGADDYEKAIAALKYAYEYRNRHNIKCRILSSYIVTNTNVDEAVDHYENIRDYVDDFAFFGMSSFAGAVAEETESLKSEFNPENMEYTDFPYECPCQFLNNSININVEGYLTACVVEHMNFTAIEDLSEMSLKEAWYSDRMVAFRQRHKEKNIKGLVCYNCVNGTAEPVVPINTALYERAKRGK